MNPDPYLSFLCGIITSQPVYTLMVNRQANSSALNISYLNETENPLSRNSNLFTEPYENELQRYIKATYGEKIDTDTLHGQSTRIEVLPENNMVNNHQYFSSLKLEENSATEQPGNPLMTNLLRSAPLLYRAAIHTIMAIPEEAPAPLQEAVNELKTAIGVAHGIEPRKQQNSHELQNLLADPDNIGSRKALNSIEKENGVRVITTRNPKSNAIEKHEIHTDSQGVITKVTALEPDSAPEIQKEPEEKAPFPFYFLHRALMYNPINPKDWNIERHNELVVMKNPKTHITINVLTSKGWATANCNGILLDEEGTNNLLKMLDSGKRSGSEKEWQKLWDAFDTPIDENTETILEEFLHFPKGTSRDDIWQWFDEHSPQGTINLMKLE